MLVSQQNQLQGIDTGLQAYNTFVSQQLVILARSPSVQRSSTVPSPVTDGALTLSGHVAEPDDPDDTVELHREGRSSSRRKRPAPRFQARFRLPRWLSKRVWDVTTSSAPGSWSFQIHTFSMVPLESEIFSLYMNGDIKAIQRLFTEGKLRHLTATKTGTPCYM